MQYTYGVFFNKRLAESYGWSDRTLYDLVYDGTWVIDDFIEMCAAIYEDVDGNGKQDDTDLYAYAASPATLRRLAHQLRSAAHRRDADGNIISI